MSEISRDIIFFDLETTGVSVSKDRIVQIAVIKRFADGRPDKKKTALINPTVPIPKEASEVHKITDADVADKPTFKNLSKSLFQFFDGCDLAGYNITGFDIPMLHEEFHRCGIDFSLEGVRVIDVMSIYRKLFPRTLEACFKHYTGKDMENAHDAMADTWATAVIFDRMREVNTKEIGSTLDSMVRFYEEDEKYLDFERCFLADDDCAYFAFGKHRGKPVSSQLSYLKWMIDKGDFTSKTKGIAKKLIKSKGMLKHGRI